MRREGADAVVKKFGRLRACQIFHHLCRCLFVLRVGRNAESPAAATRTYGTFIPLCVLINGHGHHAVFGNEGSIFLIRGRNIPGAVYFESRLFLQESVGVLPLVIPFFTLVEQPFDLLQSRNRLIAVERARRLALFVHKRSACGIDERRIQIHPAFFAAEPQIELDLIFLIRLFEFCHRLFHVVPRPGVFDRAELIVGISHRFEQFPIVIKPRGRIHARKRIQPAVYRALLDNAVHIIGKRFFLDIRADIGQNFLIGIPRNIGRVHRHHVGQRAARLFGADRRRKGIGVRVKFDPHTDRSARRSLEFFVVKVVLNGLIQLPFHFRFALVQPHLHGFDLGGIPVVLAAAADERRARRRYHCRRQHTTR